MARVNLTLKVETVEKLVELGGSARKMGVTIDGLVEMAHEEMVSKKASYQTLAQQVDRNRREIARIRRWIWGDKDD